MLSTRCRLDPVEAALSRAIGRLPAAATSTRWTVAGWTRAVKRAAARLGVRLRYTVCASGVPGVHYGEWVYDLCWLRYNRHGLLLGAPLVLECEWQAGGVEDDFEKLILARATHRVMIYAPYARETPDDGTRELMDLATHYQDSRLGDRYLFGFWHEDDWAFDWIAYRLRARAA